MTKKIPKRAERTAKATMRQRAATRISIIANYHYKLSTILIGGLVVLVVGIGIGSNTQIWNDGLKVAGLKPDVASLNFSSLESTYENLAANYDGKLDTAKLIDGANHGLVAALNDPYTVYFNATEAKSFSDDLEGSFSGIGASLKLQDNVVTVASTLAGSPAKTAGVQDGDQIVAIDGASTQNDTLDKAVTAIRGKAGTSVKLGIVRGGDTALTISVTRANLTDPAVTSSVKDGIGTMTITRFDDTTAKLATAAANTFASQHVKGVVLDLRGNGGGYVDAAQSVADLWLKDKTIVSERGTDQKPTTLTSGSDPVLYGIPTIILMDGGTASASEILSAALHDNKAATLYGSQSFGKGVFQNVLDLSGGSELKVTVGHWYTPDGKNINKVGLTPDVKITPTQDQMTAGEDPVMSAALAKLGA